MGLALSPKVKYIVTPAVGFGLAGLIWGWEAYRGTVGAGETFTNPFSYILGAVAFGILGSLSLVLFSGDKKKIIRVVIFGTIGWIVAFILPAIFAYSLYISGSVLLSIILFPFQFSENLSDIFIANIGLEPSLNIGGFLIEFFLTGMIIGLLYGFILKIRILQTVLVSSIVFGTMSVLVPLSGNLLRFVGAPLFIVYLFTFAIIGLVLGLLLGRAVNYQREN